MRTTVVVEALEGLAIALGGLRESRKAILFVGEGVTTVLPPSMTRRPGSTAPATVPGRQQTLAGSMGSLERLQQIMTPASRANTAIYTLDPRGLSDSDFDLVTDPIVDTRRGQIALRDSIDQLKVLSEQTGGRASVSTNDPLPMLREMVSDTGTYYLIGYTSTQAPRDGKFHAIKVGVKRKDVEIRARPGYWAYTNEDVARALSPEAPVLAADRAAALAAVAAPKAGRLIQTWAGFDRAAAGARTAVTIVWELDSASAPRAARRVNVVVTSATGDLLFRGRPSEPDAVSGRVTFDAPPGMAHLRASLQGESGQFLDSEERDVPDPRFDGRRTARDDARALPRANAERTHANCAPPPRRCRRPCGASPASITCWCASVPTVRPGRRPRSRCASSTCAERSWRRCRRRCETPAGAFEAVLPLGTLAPGNYLVEIEAATGDERSRVEVGFVITP